LPSDDCSFNFLTFRIFLNLNIIKTYRAAYSGLPKAAWMLSLAVFINRSGSMVLFFLSLYLTREMQYSVAQAGQLLTLYGIGALGGSYLGGYLTDKMGSMKVQIISLLSSGIGYIILGKLQSYYEIAVMLFLLAVLAESFRPANAAAMAEVCTPDLRPRGYTLNRLAINLGITIGPAAGGILAAIRYDYIFWVDGLTCIIAGLLLLIYFRITTQQHVTGTNSEQTAVKEYFWQDKIFIMVLVLIFFCGLIFVQLFNTWPIYLREQFGLSEKYIGLYLTLNALMIVLLEMPLVHKIEKFNHKKIMAVGALLLGVGFSMLAVGNGPLFISLTVVIWTTGEMLVFPFVVSFIAGRSSEKNRGVFMGMYNISFSLSVVFGPLIGTSIYDFLGPAILWYCCGFLGLLACAGFLYINTIGETVFKV
jgi:predicted MFS family arabinose efflux permease